MLETSTITSLRVLTGPPCSGKTDELAQLYADRLRKARSNRLMPRVLWLAPHRLAVDDVRRRLIASGIDASLSPGLKTFARFGEAILSGEISTPTILPRSAARWLLHQAIEAARDRGQLELLREAALRPGLLDAVEQMIGQWKVRGISAEQYKKFAYSKRATPRDRELATIFARYEEQLTSRSAADSFDVGRLAARSLQSQGASSSNRWDLVVIDGFSSFSCYEREIFVQLAERADEMWVSLSVAGTIEAEGEAKSDLSIAARRTLASLRRSFPELELRMTDAADPSRIEASLARLRDNLFATRPTKPSDKALATADRITIIAGSDAQDEFVQIARRVKALLTSTRVPPRDVIVATPTLGAHRHRMQEVFARFGVPVSIGAPRTIGEAPEVRALESVLALEAEDWPFRRVLETLGNGLLKNLDGPSASAARWPTARGATEWIVRELQIADRRKSLLESLSRLAATEMEQANSRQQAALIAVPTIELLAAACDAMPSSATPLDWVTACEVLASSLGLALEPTAVCAWRQVREAAAWVERTSESTPNLKLSEWLAQLRDWCAWVPISTSLDEEGRVRVLSAEAARHTAVPHLFLVGLSEQSFSSADSASGLYTLQQYDALAAAVNGPNATPPATRGYQRAMQLFHDLVCRATESLTFSFAALDGKGQLAPPSPLLEEACRAFGPPLTEAITNAPSISFLPPKQEQPRSHKGWRLRAVAEGLDKKPRLLGSLLAGAATRSTGDSLTAALTLIHDRSRGNDFGPFEGLATSPTVRNWLAQEFGPDHLWSTSQLEGYATCPYQFLVKQVMHLEPLGDLALETDYRRRGSLLHHALVELHQRLDRLSADARQPSDHPETEFHATFDAAVEAVLENYASFGAEGVLNELLAIKIRQWATSYREQHANYDAQFHDWDVPLTPTYFELRFGDLKRRAGEDPEDKSSTDQPLVVDLGNEKLLVGGRIDRIDVGQVAGSIVFQVIDYKSAISFTVNDEEIRNGRKLQPALYAMAAAEIVATPDAPALPLRSGYWVVQAQGFTDKTSRALHEVDGGDLKPATGWEELETAVKERLKIMIAGVRNGDFPMHNSDDKCTSRCDFSHVCRVHQVRSLGKVWPHEEHD
ncbi:MAG: PD-(D/E)XK nuclease family protein [Aeoliella sp.]